MTFKSADDFMEEFVLRLRPLKTTAVVVREDKARPEHDFNWVASTGPLSPDAKCRYEDAIIDMRQRYPRLNWEGISERDGDWRVVQRWVSDDSLVWNKFLSDDRTPKDRRLLLITQPSGTFDIGQKDIYDVVVGHWDKYRGGFSIAEEPNITVTTSLKVLYWADMLELPLTPPMKLRDIPGLA